MQRSRLFGDSRSVAHQVHFLHELVAFGLVLPAKGVRIRAALDFSSIKRCGYESRTGLMLDLPDLRAVAGDEKLIDAMKIHGHFRKSDILHLAEFSIDLQHQVQAA